MNMQVEIKASFDEEGTLNIDLNGDEMGVLIGKRGQTLDSLQHLVSLVINKHSERNIFVSSWILRITVKEEKETLEQLAKNIA